MEKTVLGCTRPPRVLDHDTVRFYRLLRFALMHLLDWIILAISLVGIISFGLYRSRGSRGMRDYLLASKAMPWWVIGMSIMATQASAITFIGTTGQGYVDGIRFVQFYFGLPIAMVLIAAIAVPFFHRSGVYTAYEYLEQRFDLKTRTLASVIFLIQRGLGVGIALYAPAVLLSIMVGWPEWLTIFTMGVLVVCYTTIGGIKAVMWTDVQQMFIIFMGVAIALAAAVLALPPDVSFSDALFLAGAAGKLRAVDTTFDWQNRYNLWSGLIGGAFLALAYFGCDQSQVQRYLTGKSVAHMRLSLLLNAVLKVPLQFIILLTGAMVFSFFVFTEPPMLFNKVERTRLESSTNPIYAETNDHYHHAFEERRRAAHSLLVTKTPSSRTIYLDADKRLQMVRKKGMLLAADQTRDNTYNDTNYIFLTFVMNYLPTGLVGLIMAAVFAAAMSSISSELNSLATVTVMDHYRRYLRRNASDSHYARVSKIATLFWGGYAVLFAGLGQHLGSLIEAVNMVGSLFYGSLLGVFVLAFLPWRVNGRGAFSGMLAALAVVAWTSYSTDVSFLWYNLVGCVVCVSIGVLVSYSKQSVEQS